MRFFADFENNREIGSYLRLEVAVADIINKKR
jgi:hypothetical protein